MGSISDGDDTRTKIVEHNTAAIAAADTLRRDATPPPTRPVQYTSMIRTSVSTYPTPILALAVPEYEFAVKVKKRTNKAPGRGKVKRKTNKALATSPSTDEQCRKGHPSVGQVERAAAVAHGEEEKYVALTCHAMIRRCTSELPLSQEGSSDAVFIERAAMGKKEDHRAWTTCISHKVKKSHAIADVSSQGHREVTGIKTKKKHSSRLPAPRTKKMNCTSDPAISFALDVDEKLVEELEISDLKPITNTTISKKNISRGIKKKKKKKMKNGEALMITTWKENMKETSSCKSDGINKQSLNLFDNIIKAFRYTGMKRFQEPPDYVKSHFFTANATSSAIQMEPMIKSAICQHKRTMTKAEKMQNCYRRINTDNMWVPPNSPYDLLQEDHFFDPWRILVICMLLNQTTGEQVRKILRRVFLICPTAEAAVQAPENELKTIITSLGLQNKRVRDIREMSRQYLEDGWTHVTQLHGVGKYAADSYAIFCVGKPEDIVPNDHMLVKYWEFVVQWKHERQLVLDSVNC